MGLDLGLEEAGIEAACYVEADPDCLRLIRSRRPGVPVVEDVKAVTAETLAAAGAIDVVAGGFPCQDLSYAGRGAGLHEGERSALWFEMLRIVEDVRPRLVLAENVPGLTRGLPVVLHGLARAGYVGRWFAVSAASVGAPHLRERIFVAARRVDDGVRAERLGEGHPVGEFRDDGWFDLQGSLFDQEPLRRLGKRGRWTLEAVFEEDARLALDDGAEETLLPTPTPTAEYVDEVREAGVDPEARLYLPGRKWHAQRTLSRIAPLVGEVGQDPEALLPTPQGSDGERGPDYARQRERRESHGSGGDDLTTTVAKMLPTPAARDAKGPHTEDREGGLDLGSAAQKLLPTPVVTDSFGSRRSTARTDEWTPNPGTTLTDAIWEAQGRETDTTGKLLPTPTATYPGGSEEDFLERKGREPDGAIHLNHAVEKLLPTPVANPDNPGSGGELRAAIEHGPERRNGTGVDSLGRPNEGRPSKDKLLPTPNAGIGDEGRGHRGQDPEKRRAGGHSVSLEDVSTLWRDEARIASGLPPTRLLPTPQDADGDGGRQEKGAMRAGGKRPSGQKGTLPLGTAVAMSDEISESPFSAGADDQLVLLPTPDTVSRKSRRALTSSGAGDGNGKRSGGGMSSPPGLEQVAEVVAGEYPHDFPEYEDLAPATRRVVDSLLPTAADGDVRQPTERLLPTPMAQPEHRKSEQARRPRGEGGMGSPPGLIEIVQTKEVSWGVYEAAVRRWEATCGREAPAPTDEKGRLDPAFVTWMMDYPEGWLDVDGISRTAALRILGNSVVVRVGYRAGLALLALDRELTA